MRKRLVGTDHHNDEAFLDLSIGARLVYLHLITHPQMTSLGLLRITVGGLADECDLDRSDCDAALTDLAAIGRVEVGKRCVALSADYLEVPANPSVVIGWGRIVDLLPNTDLVRRRMYRAVSMVRQRAEEVGRDKGGGWLDAIPEAMVRLADEASGARASGPSGVRYLDVVAPAAMRVTSVGETVVPETVPGTSSDTLFEIPAETVAETPKRVFEAAEDAAPADPPPQSSKRPSGGALDDVEHGAPHHAGHGARDGVEHRVRDGVPHSIFHLPTSSIQIPSSQSRLACSDAGACEADDGWGREGLLMKASAVVRRQLEVEEIEMVDAWLADGIPILLIESALADGLRTQVFRLKWVDRRLGELVKGHLHQHPELEHDDLDLERSVALSSLANDEITGHLSKSRRKQAKAAVRRADSAEQVRTIIDDVLVA